MLCRFLIVWTGSIFGEVVHITHPTHIRVKRTSISNMDSHCFYLKNGWSMSEKVVNFAKNMSDSKGMCNIIGNLHISSTAMPGMQACQDD